MRDRFLALWRTSAQALFTLLAAWLIGHGLNIGAHWSGFVELLVVAAGAGLWAAATHWLQSQTGDHWSAKLARYVGRVLVLGAGSLPDYRPAPGTAGAP